MPPLHLWDLMHRLRHPLSLRRSQAFLLALVCGCAPVGLATGSEPGSDQTPLSPRRETPSRHNATPAQAALSGAPKQPEAWTYNQNLWQWLPVSAAAVDDLQAESRHIATIDGRVVWMNLRGSDAQQRLRQLGAPVALSVDPGDPQRFEEVDRIARSFAVDIASFVTGRTADFRPLGRLQRATGLTMRSLGPNGALPTLGRFERLRRLTIQVLTADELPLGTLPDQLEELSLVGNYNPRVVQAVARLRRLKRLELAVDLRDLDLRALADLKQLEELSLGVGVHVSDLTPLLDLPHLRVLHIPGALSNAEVPLLLKLQALRDLQLWGSALDDEGVSDLAQGAQLETLSLPRGATLRSVYAIKTQKDLGTLSLAFTSLGDSAIPPLAQLPKLTSLRLTKTQISDAAAPALARLTTLESLDLQGTRVSGKTLRQLGTLVQLRELNLKGTLIRDSDLASLAAFPELRQLQIDGVGDVGIAHIAKLPNLRLLTMEAGATRASAGPLVAMPRLLFLGVHSKHLKCADVEEQAPLLWCLDG